jgi:hypothetical protein
MKFSPDEMLSNAAVASQHIALVDDEVVRGAVLRSIRQWLILNQEKSISQLVNDLESHTDFGS